MYFGELDDNGARLTHDPRLEQYLLGQAFLLSGLLLYELIERSMVSKDARQHTGIPSGTVAGLTFYNPSDILPMPRPARP